MASPAKDDPKHWRNRLRAMNRDLPNQAKTECVRCGRLGGPSQIAYFKDRPYCSARRRPEARSCWDQVANTGTEIKRMPRPQAVDGVITVRTPDE